MVSHAEVASVISFLYIPYDFSDFVVPIFS